MMAGAVPRIPASAPHRRRKIVLKGTPGPIGQSRTHHRSQCRSRVSADPAGRAWRSADGVPRIARAPTDADGTAILRQPRSDPSTSRSITGSQRYNLIPRVPSPTHATSERFGYGWIAGGRPAPVTAPVEYHLHAMQSALGAPPFTGRVLDAGC